MRWINFEIAKSCGDPSNSLVSLNQQLLEGASLPSNPTEGAEWNAICISGFKWTDGSQQIAIKCNGSLWSFPSWWELMRIVSQRKESDFTNRILMQVTPVIDRIIKLFRYNSIRFCAILKFFYQNFLLIHDQMNIDFARD